MTTLAGAEADRLLAKHSFATLQDKLQKLGAEADRKKHDLRVLVG